MWLLSACFAGRLWPHTWPHPGEATLYPAPSHPYGVRRGDPYYRLLLTCLQAGRHLGGGGNKGGLLLTPSGLLLTPSGLLLTPSG